MPNDENSIDDAVEHDEDVDALLYSKDDEEEDEQ